MEIKKEKLHAIFDYDKKVEQIAQNIFDRIDEEEEDLSQAIIDAVDAELFYTANQWAIIAYYSEPNAPMALNDAIQSFIDDLVKVA